MLYCDEVTFIDFLKVSFYFFLFVFKNFSKTLFQRRSLRFVYQTFKLAGFRFRVSARLLNSQASDLPCAAVGHVFRGIPSLKAALRMLSPNGEKIPPSKFNFLFFWKQVWLTKHRSLTTIILRKKIGSDFTLYGFYSILNLRLKFWSASPNLFSNDS